MMIIPWYLIKYYYLCLSFFPSFPAGSEKYIWVHLPPGVLTSCPPTCPWLEGVHRKWSRTNWISPLFPSWTSDQDDGRLTSDQGTAVLSSYSPGTMAGFKRGHDGKIAGLYDLDKTLGRGHFAVVKLARHVFTGEKVLFIISPPRWWRQQRQ